MALTLLFAGVGRAASQSEWSVTEEGAVRLIAAVSAVGDSGRVQLGLQFAPKPGWKIYWRSPGDAGYPPTIDWKGSGNLQDTVMSWPAPKRFSIQGLETLGYDTETVLPIVAMVADQTQPLSLNADIDYLTCKVTCVPEHATLTLDIPAGPAEASPFTHLISRFVARVPGNGVAQGLSIKAAEATERGKLKVVVDANPPLVAPDLFVERADNMQFAAPRVIREQGGRHVIFYAKPIEKTGEGELTDQPVTLTIVDGNRAMEAGVDVAPPKPGARIGTLLLMLATAFLGGLVLNVMPCVLPVLSIKLLSAIRLAGAERSHIRQDFLASAAGIVFSFAVLSLAAVAVKLAGSWVGWGIQFQQPWFLAFMILVVVLFSANLWGLFEIPMPSMAVGLSKGGERSRWAANFVEGAFATLLATPCSAPFVGTALGFALARGPLEIVLIFLALGLGMAVPYLIVASWPGVASRLPRPGLWMVNLRRLLGLVLLGTAGWLMSVLAVQTQTVATVAVGALMAGVLAVLALRRKIPVLARGVVVGMLGISSMVVAVTADSAPSADIKAEAKFKDMWQPFDADAIAKLVAENKIVFVDVTADWCLTCQVNKATILYREPVAARLKKADMVVMRADWTRPNDQISAYLASFNRYAIPFDVVYGPSAPDGIALPELLTSDAVMDGINQAGASRQ